MIDKSIKNVLSFKLFKVLYLIFNLGLNVKLSPLFIYNFKYFATLFNSLGKENLFSTKLNLIDLRILNYLDFMHLFLLVKTKNLSKLKHLINPLNFIPVDVFSQKVSWVMLQLVIEVAQ